MKSDSVRGNALRNLRSTLKSTFFTIAVLGNSLASSRAQARDSVSDDRVANLSCQNVNADAVALAMRPEVYDVANHLPYQNWSFRWGFYDLANCWSLSRFQRLYFMMREPGANIDPTSFSNQARSEDMYDDQTGWKGFPLKTFWFLPDQSDPSWRVWEKGWTDESGLSSKPLPRGLDADIEYYQVLRFHQIDNLKYLEGPVARTVAENQATWSELASLIQNGRKPLLLLRPKRDVQHVVVAKRVELTATGANIWVYDSNAPELERPVVWDRASSMFTALEIVSGMVPDPQAPLGIFIVDQDENEKILQWLVSYYQQICSQP